MTSLLNRIATRLGFVPQAVAAEQATQAADLAGKRVGSMAAAQRRSLLAALTTNDVASWSTEGLHINADTATGLVTVRARSRDAAINNGYARRFVGMARSNVLGPHGVRYQARVRSASGELKTAVNARLEAGWAAWGRRGVCDVTGRYTWRDVQRLALRHTVVDGECFIRFMPGQGAHGIQVQLLPADVVPVTYEADLGSGIRIRQGVEIDVFGRVRAYHMRRDDTTLDNVGEWAGSTMRLLRVPADEVLHIMLPENIGQLRGVPWMATALKRMYQAADFASSGLNKARESAKRGGWLKPSLDAPPPGPGELTDGTDADGTDYQSLHDGTWEQLPAGMEATPFESDYPNIEYGQFIKDCVRDMAGALDVAYITLGNDLEAVNYSSGQLGLEGERTTWLSVQEWLIQDAMIDAVHRRWLRYALIAAPELDGLAYDKLEMYAAAARWQAHRWHPIDPLKTIKAQRERIDARLTSPQRVIAETGEDPDEVIAELLEWEQKTARLPKPVAPGAPAAAQPEEPEDDTAAATAARRLQLIASRGLHS